MNSRINENDISPVEIMRIVANQKLSENRLSKSQYDKNMKIINTIAQDEIGKIPICNITAKDLENYFYSFIYYSSSYLQKYYSQFSQAFSYAQKAGYTKQNPICSVSIPKFQHIKKTIKILRPDEQEELTNYLQHRTLQEEPLKNAFLLQLYCGLKGSEVLALSRDDIDLQDNIVHINKTISTNEENKIVIKKLYSSRNVPIPNSILPKIKEQVEVSKNNSFGGLFLSSSGKYISLQNMNYALKKILLQNFSITGITTQSLRNTFLVRCIESNIPSATIQKIMGYNNIGKIYNYRTNVLDILPEYLENTNYDTSRKMIDRER